MAEPIVLTGLRSVDGASCTDPDTGQVYLFLNEGQTMDSAFTRGRRLLEGLPSDTMRRLVRRAMPAGTAGGYSARGMVDPSDLLTAKDRPSHRSHRPAPIVPTVKGRWRLLTTGVTWGICASLVSGLAVYELSEFRHSHALEEQVSLDAGLKRAFYAAGVNCLEDDDPITLSCSDVDGTAMVGEVTSNRYQAAYVFFSGYRQSLVLRDFINEDQASAWARRGGSRDRLPMQVGSVTFAGSDPVRAGKWAAIASDHYKKPVVTYDEDGTMKVLRRPA